MNENQNKPKQEAPKNAMGEASAAKSSNGVRKLLTRKWVAPAAFMAAAAIIVTLMWIYQGADDSVKTSTTGIEQTESTNKGDAAKPNDDALEVIRKGEKMEWPVANKEALQVELPFFDKNASAEEQAKAVVQAGNDFSAHLGIDLVDPNDQPFDVQAALSGKVTSVIKHPTNGNVVEISHGDGLVTVYQSLSEVAVAEGDEVKQGTVIAKAGRNELERDLGYHLHFGVLKDGEAVNPSTAVGQQ
ncbi:M23 family metallopeptidase [Paenibacillus sp. NEAU-GSW1]|uniref:M23 family metallopeptidase n=1 Tax=Paenibacillus sp. NEAU-GSW1 TaxID=2682486 RepID=UPI0012E285C8|nr:M23 family metallopeptidase [Paenibacillus sp. NEAU-GSW1]MUT65052.1 peptidoglycan DD-metalloendopeptidase family protein [Paenibacillus sp. NEAU-GSW1]